MKKNLLFLLLIHIVTNSFSQKKELFKPGANIVENTIVSEFNSKSSILFIFKHLLANFNTECTRC